MTREEFNNEDINKVNEKHRKDPRFHNTKGEIYLACTICKNYYWFKKENSENPKCVYCILDSIEN